MSLPGLPILGEISMDTCPGKALHLQSSGRPREPVVKDSVGWVVCPISSTVEIEWSYPCDMGVPYPAWTSRSHDRRGLPTSHHT